MSVRLPTKGPVVTKESPPPSLRAVPQGLVYTLDVDDIDRLNTFVKVQLTEQRVAKELNPVPVSYKKMVLVCTHGSRDKRCGRAGPQVGAAPKRLLLLVLLLRRGQGVKAAGGTDPSATDFAFSYPLPKV